MTRRSRTPVRFRSSPLACAKACSARRSYRIRRCSGSTGSRAASGADTVLIRSASPLGRPRPPAKSFASSATQSATMRFAASPLAERYAPLVVSMHRSSSMPSVISISYRALTGASGRRSRSPACVAPTSVLQAVRTRCSQGDARTVGRQGCTRVPLFRPVGEIVDGGHLECWPGLSSIPGCR